MGNRSAGLAPFAPEALAAYRAALAQPGAVHAMCEDYRASATIDLEHDRADLERGNKVACPLRVLWGRTGSSAAASIRSTNSAVSRATSAAARSSAGTTFRKRRRSR